MENTPHNQDFINFLKLYQSEEFAERLHQALYYVIAEGDVYPEKQDVCEALFYIRRQLDSLQAKYLPQKDILPNYGQQMSS